MERINPSDGPSFTPADPRSTTVHSDWREYSSSSHMCDPEPFKGMSAPRESLKVTMLVGRCIYYKKHDGFVYCWT